MKLGLIVITMRQHGPHIAKLLARQALAEAQHLHERTGVVGFDIAGPERGNPPRLYRSAYEMARLGRLGLTAHAGEDAPADYVWQAVDELGVDRIGHGCAAAQDPELVRRLARDKIAVEVCLSSNFHTGAVKRGARHPLHAFLEAGVPVALCCDNSTVSRTDALRESLLAAAQVGIDAVEHIHRAADVHTFIKPETALATRQDD
jgi:adenosine deaminase